VILRDRRRVDGGLAFYWDNLGPMHIDRLAAVKRRFPHRQIVGVELRARSATYDWTSTSAEDIHRVTLYQGTETPGSLSRALKLLQACRHSGAETFFLCNYEEVSTLLVAFALRALGKRVFVMGVSKFDDQKRHLWREVGKSLFMLPYLGAIGSGKRPKDYLRFLGISEGRITGEYNTLSIDRIRQQTQLQPAPGGAPYSDRVFVAVARFVPKKNLQMLLKAYALYAKGRTSPRRLSLCGSGPQEAELRDLCDHLEITQLVDFRGFVQTGGISEILGKALALLLPSIEEQFGNVVIEAQAMGVPSIVSDNCGARDELVRNAVNGFVVEPDNPQGLAWFMSVLGADPVLWAALAENAYATAAKGDVAAFAAGVAELIGTGD
jgi:glycosyltransferase involved in cell wall biosynthesis